MPLRPSKNGNRTITVGYSEDSLDSSVKNPAAPKMSSVRPAKKVTSVPGMAPAWINTAIHWTFFGLVFLLPLFFMPQHSDFLEMPKQAVLVIGALVISILSGIEMIMTRRFTVKASLVSLASLIALVGGLVVACFSRYPIMSFVGLDQEQSYSFLTIGLLTVLTWKATTHFDVKKMPWLMGSFFISNAIVVILGLLSMFNVNPFLWMGNVALTNTVGSSVAWGAYLAISLVAGIGVLLRYAKSEYMRPWGTILRSIVVLLNLAGIILVHDWRVWIPVVVGTVTLLVLGLIRAPKEKKLSWSVFPGIVTLLSAAMLVMIFNHMALPISVTTPLDVTPSMLTTIHIAWDTLRSSPIVGFGQGTFSQSYTLFKPHNINAININQYWNAIFDQGGSALFTAVAAGGAIAILTLLACFGIWKWYLYRLFKSLSFAESTWTYFAVGGAGVATAIVALVCAGATMSLVFAGWVMLMVIGLIQRKTLISIPTDKSSRWFVPMVATTIISSIAIILGLVTYGQLLYSDLAYASALRMDQQMTQQTEPVSDKQIDEFIGHLNTAVSANNLVPDYHRVLGLALAYKASMQAASATSQDQLNVLKDISDKASKEAMLAFDRNPHDVRNATTVIRVYQTLASFTEGTEPHIQQYLDSAIALDPSNPSLYYQKGSILVNLAITGKEKGEDTKDLLSQANEQFQKSVALKPDYAPAYLQLGIIKINQGDNTEALRLFDVAMKYNVGNMSVVGAADINTFYSLGVAYRSIKEYDRAQTAFQYVLRMQPDHANAQYQVALINEDQGNYTAALAMVNQLLAADPKNPILVQKKEDLEKKAKTPTPEPSSQAPEPDTTKK